jgi:hypothetical protein
MIAIPIHQLKLLPSECKLLSKNNAGKRMHQCVSRMIRIRMQSIGVSSHWKRIDTINWTKNAMNNLRNLIFQIAFRFKCSRRELRTSQRDLPRVSETNSKSILRHPPSTKAILLFRSPVIPLGRQLPLRLFANWSAILSSNVLGYSSTTVCFANI